MYSDNPDPKAVGEQWNHRMARGIRHTMQVREQHAPERFIDIHFADTLKQPLQVLESVYAFANLAFTDQARALGKSRFRPDGPGFETTRRRTARQSHMKAPFPPRKTRR